VEDGEIPFDSGELYGKIWLMIDGYPIACDGWDRSDKGNTEDGTTQ
jgi:hypothetical protein